MPVYIVRDGALKQTVAKHAILVVAFSNKAV